MVVNFVLDIFVSDGVGDLSSSKKIFYSNDNNLRTDEVGWKWKTPFLLP
jgi:hypothetical protein